MEICFCIEFLRLKAIYGAVLRTPLITLGSQMKTRLLSIFAALTLVACATPVTQSEIQKAKFPPQPKQAEIDKEVSAYLKTNINEPEAAKKVCAPPRKAWARTFSYESPKFGWMVVCDVNAKERSGGYGPLKAYMFLFTENGNFSYDSSSFANINNNVQFLDLIK